MQRFKQYLESEKNKVIHDNFGGIIIGLYMFQLCMFVVLMLFKVGAWHIHLITALIVTIYYLFMKDYASEGGEKIGFFILRISLSTLVLAMVNSMFVSGINNIQDMKLRGSIATFMIIFDVAILIIMIAVFNMEKIKDFLTLIRDTNIINGLSGNETKEEIKDGDMVLGKQVIGEKVKPDGKIEYELGDPVILPLKDRYLHMLIIGPTGSGKTSQTIIPAIWRDVQNPDLGVTVIEPKGDLAEKVWAMAKKVGREVVYFNPTHPDCPLFNPLAGKESDVVENMSTTFKMLNPDSPQFFLDMNDNLIRNGLKILKRLKGDKATLLDFYTLLWNPEGRGKKIVQEFSKLPARNTDIQKENEDLASYFLNDYFTGASGDRGATKSYEHTSGVRSQVSKLVSNKHLRRVLNPPNGENDVDFDDALANGKIITIATAQGELRDLGRYLGYFIILQLQASVFRRPGNENTRRGNMLFIDEFQVYTNPGLCDTLV